ncbi:MAG: YibE/F family protein, partial [Negativicutes bacterium]|nr:YibE/F family protein [Negativicutes bacterium]
MKKIALLCIMLFVSLFTAALAAPENEPAPLQYEKGIVRTVAPLEQSGPKQYLLPKGELVTLEITSGSETGKVVESVNYVDEHSPYSIKVAPGDKVIVAISRDMGRTTYNVSDFDRLNYVYVLLGIFVICLVVFAGVVGVRSVLVIGFSVVLIFKVYIGQVLSGQFSITLLTLLICSLIAVVTQVSISGWNRKSLAAVLGTVGGVIIAGLLSVAAIQLMHLTGLDSEEAMLLKAAKLARVDFQGVLFSGMVFGALGAVMDVTISIASALYEVKAARPELGLRELFVTGMNVGRDIMGTMSNTLILAYTGGALPLMLLIASQP